MKISLGQFNPLVGDLDYNFKKIIKCIAQAQKEKSSLIIFPEMSLIGYPPKDLVLKTDLMNYQNDILEELKLYSNENFAIIIGGISKNLGYGKKLQNSIFCIANGKIETIASKTLLPSYDVFDETRYFEPAKQTSTWTWQGIKFGLSICEDIWIEAYQNLYSKNPIEELAAQNSQIIINVSASPYVIGKPDLREKLVGSIAEKYNLPVIYTNQVGANDQLIFDGNSMVFNKKGKAIVKLKAFEEDYVSIETEELFKDDKPALVSTDDAKINLAEIEQALVLGTRDYITKCGFSKAVLGLSGGIDSALVAYIASKAIGKENVSAYMLPSEFTSRESLDDAEQLAKNLDINYQIISIEKLHGTIKNLVPNLEGLADENVQPRLRANILMAFSNMQHAILLATSNKSEIAVGYSTLYGDTCGAIAVIGDLLKTTIYDLVTYINRDSEIIPQRIIDKAPSAELRHDQKDSDSLPEYEVLDKIVLEYVQELKTLQEIVAMGFDKALVKKVLNMIDRAEYKRQQLPPVLKIAGKAFGVGRRMPLAQGFRHK